MHIIITAQKKHMTRDQKAMINSCYTYGQLNSRYMDNIRKEVDSKEVDEYIKYLQDNYTIESNVYTDHEGCTYNSMVKN